MKYGSLVIEKNDYTVLKKYLNSNLYLVDYIHQDALETLDKNLKSALVLSSEDMPNDIVRIESTVTMSSISNVDYTFQLVLLQDEDSPNQKISVTSTMGASVIGRSEDDIINYGPPADRISLRIRKVGGVEAEGVEV
ncbi:GreA/GreB family elongation factor [Zobellia alginiliquefaciens]|uniref:GreA/GreB family elongation factor n=1 Tax=Zobellia alginiliquefaciens TaxID=3032586 RepID=UPI0023E3CF06|nr:GreA/GreB family elongation factor [Zobellia alginiliquefaciens]